MSATQDLLYNFLLNEGIDDGDLQEMWREYLDGYTDINLSGVSINDAERFFLLDALEISSSDAATQDLWRAYLADQGYSSPSDDQNFRNWIFDGGALVITEDWILLSGVWNDSGQWDDSAVWNDGV